MKPKNQHFFSGILLILFIAAVSVVNARSGEHAAYLRALSDLRSARWMLDHRPGNYRQTDDEAQAVKSIDAAVSELKKSSIDDGRDMNYNPQIANEKDKHLDRLNAAIDFLNNAKAEVNKEDEGFGRGLKARALQNINLALEAANRAVRAGHEMFK